MDILIIGLGTMGFAIAEALVTSKNPRFVISAKITATNTSRTFLKKVKTLGITTHTHINTLMTKNYDVILLAVKPNDVNTSITELIPLLQKQIKKSPPLILSIVAGISTQYITQLIHKKIPHVHKTRKNPYIHVIRLMPTLAAQKKQSITALSPSIHTTQKSIQTALTIANSFGQVITIKETLMHTFTGVAGSGIAFAASFIDALTHAGISEGMSKTHAYTAALLATKGALVMLEPISKKEKNTCPSFPSPADLIAAVSSPKGTTHAGMSVLQKKTHNQNLFTLIQNAVYAASKKSKDINKQK